VTSQNEQTKVVEGRELSSFFILATAIAAFALMFVRVLATLNHHLAASIETVLARSVAPEQSEPRAVAVTQAEKR
jgi:hypothetical protein